MLFLKQALDLAPFEGALAEIPAELHLGLAHCYCLLGESDHALAELHAAVDLGYAEDLKQDADLRNLSGLPELSALAGKTLENAHRRRVFDFKRWDNPDLKRGPEFQPFPLAQLERLRTYYKLDEVIAPGRTELDKQLLMLAWVHSRWAHDSLDEPSAQDAWTILHEVEQGKRFRCVEYSIVLAECLQAVGFPARSIGLRCDNASFGTGKGHVVSEVWNNELHRWILLDGQNNAYWELAGMPLSADDVRQALRTGKEGLRFVTGPSSWRGEQSASEWNVYFHHLTYPGSLAYLGPGENYELLFQGTTDKRGQTSDADLIYPRLNLVHADVSAFPDKTGLLLKLSHSTPWFSHYLLELDGASQICKDAEFRWTLKPGRNRLTVRAVNARGVLGSPSVLDLEYSSP